MHCDLTPYIHLVGLSYHRLGSGIEVQGLDKRYRPSRFIDASIMHRVVVDVPRKVSKERLIRLVWDQLMAKIQATVSSNGLEFDNIVSIKLDIECPYGTFDYER